MATPPVLKKEYIDMVPTFNGESQLLARFIEICEKLVARFYNVTDPTDFQNEYLMSSILAKINGPAAEVVGNSRIGTWQELKEILLNGYADRRDCYTLGIELAETRQGPHESPFEFFGRIQKILNLQIAYLNNHINHAEARILVQYSKSFALRVLLRNLREPIGSLMRTKNPPDLSSALNMLTNDFQFDVDKKPSLPPNVHRSPPGPGPRPPKPFYREPYTNNYPKNNSSKQIVPVGYYKPTPMSISTRTQPERSFNRTSFKSTPMSVSTRNTTFQNRFPRATSTPNKYATIDEINNINEPENENDFLGQAASERSN
jgi:hypothetical protein